MSKPEDELEFINVVEHGDSSKSTVGSGMGGMRGAAAGGGGAGGEGMGFAGGSLGIIRQSRHPRTAFFHYFFKGLALFFYIMGGWKIVSSNTVVTYILCILFLAFDFWTVKNVSGRLMVRHLVVCTASSSATLARCSRAFTRVSASTEDGSSVKPLLLGTGGPVRVADHQET